MLALVLAMGLWMPVCLTRQCSVKAGEQIELIFGTKAIFCHYSMLKESWVSRTPDLENFALAYQSLKHVIDLARQVDAQCVINCTVIGQLS